MAFSNWQGYHSHLKSVGTVKDIAAAYRASGTACLAAVVAVVQWSGEPRSPQMFYPAGFDADHIHSVIHKCSLETPDAETTINGRTYPVKRCEIKKAE